MPRYSTVNIRDIQLLGNTPPIRGVDRSIDPSKLYNYSNLSSDVKLDWNGDLSFNDDEHDFQLSHTVEAYVQGLYFRLATQRGQYPEDGNFGWNFQYLYNLTVVEQQALLPRVVNDVRSAVMADPDTLSVADVTAYIERLDEHTHSIVIEITAKPRSVQDQIVLTIEMTPSEGED